MNTNHVTHNLQLSAWANRIREQQVSGLNIEYSVAMKSRFRRNGNQQTGSRNHQN